MAAFFTVGEKKKRPGIYYRVTNIGGVEVAGAIDGICAAIFRAPWGPLCERVELECESNPEASVTAAFGTGMTTFVPIEQFKGGAKLIYAVRLGSGGSKGNLTLQTAGEVPVDCLTIEAKYVGTRSFAITIRDTLEYEDKRELLVLEGTYQRERFLFDKGENEISSLLGVFEEQKGVFVNIRRTAGFDGDGTLAPLNQQEMTPGTDPAVTNEDYASAFEKVETVFFNRLAVDSEEVGVHLMLSSFIDRIYQNGNLGVATIGEPVSVPYDTRLEHSRAFNQETVEYVGHDCYDTAGVHYEGARLAARISGMFASLSSDSVLFTHGLIDGCTRIGEQLTNRQYEKAIDNGMITLSVNSKGLVWIDEAINTLVSLPDNKDAGWKKVKRTKIRFELLNRVSETVSELRVRNDSDGRAAVVQAAQGVCNAMSGENKILPGATVREDESNPPMGDQAWFTIQADDIDALEKIYFVFQFRFSQNA